MTIKKPVILAIGGANIDITGISNDKIRLQDSNPGRLQLCMGGVIRNIAENLCSLNIPVKLISAFGRDVYGQKLVQHCQKIDLDTSLVLISEQFPTSTYLSIIDENGDMIVAINNMDILDQLTIEYFQSLKDELELADILVIDTNLNPDVIEYLLKNVAAKVFLDTVSAKKAVKITPYLSNLHTLKTNKIEAEILTGIPINSVVSAQKALDYFLEQGLSNVYITMGKAGVVFGGKNQKGHYIVENVKTINETGAGDAFMAGVVYGFINELSIEDSTKWASAASILTSKCELTNHPDFSVQTIQMTLNQN